MMEPVKPGRKGRQQILCIRIIRWLRGHSQAQIGSIFKACTSPAGPDTFTCRGDESLVQPGVLLAQRLQLNLPEQLSAFAGLVFLMDRNDGDCA